MGRTVPSFRMLLEEIVLDLSVFKRALRGEDKIAFDSLMNKARSHASSCTVAFMLEPIDAVFMSILVEQEKEIISLRQSLQISPILKGINDVIVSLVPITRSRIRHAGIKRYLPSHNHSCIPGYELCSVAKFTFPLSFKIK
jgi:hypothetical protein